jgi:RimJ/RimL family protein N-acetyltransferase
MDKSTEVTIASTTPEHIEGFCRALDIVAREHRYLVLLEAPPLEQTREFVLNCLKNNDPHFVALAGGEVVGWCDIRRHSLPVLAHRGTLGMGIVPAHRGRGLGLRLINAALKQARDTGFVRIELDVRADNSPAIVLYSKVGFVTEGVVRDAHLVDDEYHDVIAMALLHPKMTPQRGTN